MADPHVGEIVHYVENGQCRPAIVTGLLARAGVELTYWTPGSGIGSAASPTYHQQAGMANKTWHGVVEHID